MKNITFNNPYLLFVAIPLVLLIVVPFFIFVRRKNFHNITSLVLHVVICLLLSVAFAGLKSNFIASESVVYIMCDVSSTTNNVREEMDAYIKEFDEKLSPSTKLGVVCFAKDQEELVPLDGKIVSVNKNKCDISATNIEEALNYTVSLFPEEYKKRIVILSDGKQTDGDAVSRAKELIDNVRIDAVFFDSKITDKDYEVMIDEIQGSTSTYKNKDEELKVQIKSSFDNNSTLKVFANGNLVKEETLQIRKGINNYVYPVDTSSEGTILYRFVLENDQDYIKENNTYYFNQEVIDKPSVLLLTKMEMGCTNIVSAIEDTAKVDVLYSSQRIDASIENLVKYDEIILNDINFNEISNQTELINSLNTLSTTYGKSIITIGGQNTYMDGGYYTSMMNDMIPVNVNPSETKNATAIILVIDCSDSMSGGGLQKAKEGAKKCIEALDEKDYVGIIAFGTNTKIVWPLSHPTNPSRIYSKIDSITNDGSTMMTTALEEAYNQFRRLDFNNKEVILLSDGAPGDNNQEAVVELMAKNNIVTSTISIGSQQNILMENLAEIGNGRCYYVSNSSSLPDIMLSEVQEIIMESIIEDDIEINIVNKNDKMVEGVNSLPNVNGMNFSKAKYGATTVLATSFTLENGIEVNDAPILAYWNYGAGKVTSLMTDGNSSWSSQWENNPNVNKLYQNIIMENLPEVHVSNGVTFNAITKGYSVDLTLNVISMNMNEEYRIILTSPSGKSETKTLSIGNLSYKGNFDLSESGLYEAKVECLNNSNHNYKSYDYNFVFNYSTEYKSFEESDNILLWQIVDGSGTLSSQVDQIVNIEQEDVVVVKEYRLPFIIAALALYIIDVIIRKLRWKDILHLRDNVKKLFIKKSKN